MIPNEGQSAEPPLDFLWKAHSYTNEYIRFADAKAAFLVTIAAALAGALISSKVFDGLRLVSVADWPAAAWIAVFSILCLGSSVVCATWTVRPRLWGKDQKDVIFWGGIVRYDSADTFCAEVERLSEVEQAHAVGRHLYVLARICKRKYDWSNAAILFGTAGGLSAALAVLWIHFTDVAKVAVP
jgi:pycsar effector protein